MIAQKTAASASFKTLAAALGETTATMGGSVVQPAANHPRPVVATIGQITQPNWPQDGHGSPPAAQEFRRVRKGTDAFGQVMTTRSGHRR